MTSLENQQIEGTITLTQGQHTITLSTKNIIDMFHIFYYNSRVWERTTWMGFPVLKCPLDTWIYQEIICALVPDVIIETGTYYGGSALFMASVCDLIGKGIIITVDIEEQKIKPNHPRINYLSGSSTSKEILDQITNLIGNKKNILVILDSDHSKNHVLNEMRLYSKFVSQDSYLIVEDSNINGHPVRPDFGPGPMEAIEIFMQENRDFMIDRSKEKFFMTQNPKGFLKKIR